MSTLSDNLKYIRLIRGLSLNQVGAKLGKAANTIANWEKGKISPPIDDVVLLCDIYNISLNQLTGFEQCPEIIDFMEKQRRILTSLEKLQKERAEIDRQIKSLTEELSRESN